MALSLKPELRTSQSLVMTPQLMQAIKLLQLSSVDLAAFVDAELERNPLLERDEAGDRDEPVAPDTPVVDSKTDFDWLEPGLERVPGAAEIPAESVRSEIIETDDEPRQEPQSIPAESWTLGPSRTPVRAEDYNLEAFVAERKSLVDHLSEQLSLAAPDQTTKLIGAAIIAELDEAGYLRTKQSDLAERLGTRPEMIEKTLTLLRTFEPTGVFARDLPECLALQLKEKDRLDPAMEALLANLELIARRDYAALRRCCGVDEADLADMLEEIRALNPKPGADFDPAPVQTVIPDIMVTPAPDGGWKVELNSETLPRLLVNQSYYATVSKASRKDTERAFLAERFQTAKWLVDSLDRRARTILKVASEIVRQQDGFFVKGVEHLRPLNLRAVADAIEMHESTVSRVTSNKYMATNRGIFELKYFFTSAIQSAEGGEAHSAEAVRHRIRSLIDNETDSVLSDDAIVKVLRQSGIGIARRTVAKYREAMRIPSSVNRRRDRRPEPVGQASRAGD
jgi:RNA polymerase sigma-54 factor